MTVAQLKRFRKELDLTQFKLAKLADIPRHRIAYFEANFIDDLRDEEKFKIFKVIDTLKRKLAVKKQRLEQMEKALL